MHNLVHSILEDGRVSSLEARVFRAWVERHPELGRIPAVGDLIAELGGIFGEGKLTSEERGRLRTLLERIDEGG